MGAHTARMDLNTVRDVAGQFEATAALLDAAIRTHLSNLRFDGAGAGRAHAAHGDALRAALTSIGDGIARWSRASEQIAVLLRRSADGYRAADHRASARLA